jgi:hypothetical protein
MDVTYMALEDFNEALRLKSDYAAAFYNRSVVRHAQGGMERGLEDLKEAVRLGYDPFRVA